MTYYSHREVKQTRKQHYCEGCGTIIAVGSAAFYWAGDCDGEFYACYYHLECRKAEVEWNQRANQWGDEYTNLCLIKDEPTDVEWLSVSHPLVAERMGIKPNYAEANNRRAQVVMDFNGGAN